ncbi:response regulator transcription factor [Amycolatopsis alkalitolerans]|uniref:response regulator transcription factor n=1 Tax=Amycolatopsis alkalitolerans TaxID=2547244 RepID=UPI001F22BC44|nr:response regulator transcription factor [Amycolatopsis alkalitolerans]
MVRLLVVGDEPGTVELLAGSLRFAGFDVSTAESASAVTGARVRRPDLVVLGGSMPGLARRLRAGGLHVPVLAVGAPCTLDALVSEIDVTLRRGRLSVADIELDESTHEVFKAGRIVDLSPTEFRLLRYFLLNAGRVLSKKRLLEDVWECDFGGRDSVLESYVSYLRRKIDTTEPRLLRTVRGIGYQLRVPRNDAR